MQKLFCAIGFLTLVLIFQDCLIPAEGVRVRVVKVKRQPAPVANGHYTKRQATRGYTDVPLSGDPDPDSESFQVNTNTLRPQDNPYNVGNNNRYSESPGPGSAKTSNEYGSRNYNKNPGSFIRNPYSDSDSSGNQNQPQFQQQQQPNTNIKNNNPYSENSDVEIITPSGNPNTKRQNNPNIDKPKPPAAAVDAQGSKRPTRKDGGDGDCPECGNSIPGDAGVDYPNFHTPPKTAFSCSKQSYSGYYADTEARCQVFWICQKNRADAFLCPNGTIFNQQVFVCDWWFNSDCNTASDYYSRNQYLYAGPTVDLFGNPITPNTNANTKSKRTTPKPAAPERQQSVPQPKIEKIQAPSQRPPPPPQRVPQKSIIENNDLITSPLVPYTRDSDNVRRIENVIQPVPTTPPPPSVYNKRSQQSIAPPQNKIPYNDRSKQPFGYPVPDNSLEAVEAVGEYGLRMNNYKSALDYITSDVDEPYQNQNQNQNRNQNQNQSRNQNQNQNQNRNQNQDQNQRQRALQSPEVSVQQRNNIQSEEIQKHRQSYETQIQRQKQQSYDSQAQHHTVYSEERQRHRQTQQNYETQNQRPSEQQADDIQRQRPGHQQEDIQRIRQPQQQSQDLPRQRPTQQHSYENQRQRQSYEPETQQGAVYGGASNNNNNNNDRYSQQQQHQQQPQRRGDFTGESNNDNQRSSQGYGDNYSSKSSPQSATVYSDSTSNINQRSTSAYLETPGSNSGSKNAQRESGSYTLNRNDAPLLKPLQRQPLFSAPEVESDSEFGYGRKTQRSSNRSPFASTRNDDNSFDSQIENSAIAYSTTTKRNALDYETENTTPYTSSLDDDLVSTLTTPRYGEVVSKANAYSSEIEVPSQESTTIAPPLTFGQKLTRAAKKRNTSRWGNWRTMLLGDY